MAHVAQAPGALPPSASPQRMARTAHGRKRFQGPVIGEEEKHVISLIRG